MLDTKLRHVAQIQYVPNYSGNLLLIGLTTVQQKHAHSVQLIILQILATQQWKLDTYTQSI
jgi:hypothetical protein